MTTMLGKINRKPGTLVLIAAALIAGLSMAWAIGGGAFAQSQGSGPPSPPPGAIGDFLAAMDGKLDLLTETVEGQGEDLSSLEQQLEGLAEDHAALSEALGSLAGALGVVEPFQARADCTIGLDLEDFGEDTCGVSIRVPDDRLLIIEHISARGSTMVEEGEIISVDVQTRAGGQFGSHPLGSFRLEVRDDLVRTDALSVSLRLYSDPSSGVQLFAASDQEGSATQVFFTVTGRLVDAPDPAE